MDDALFSCLGVSGQVHALEGLIPVLWPTTALFAAPHLSSSTLTCSPPEIAEAMDGIKDVKPNSVSVVIHLAQTGNETLFDPVVRQLCRDSWSFVSAWKQSCVYCHSVPFAKDLQSLQNLQGSAVSKPFVVRTTVSSSLRGISTQHRELISSTSLDFLALASTDRPPLLIRYRTLPRRPWSSKEDAANTLSDVFMSYVGISQVGRPSTIGPVLPIDMNAVKVVRDSLAAKGMSHSEHWLNHQSMLEDALSVPTTSAAPSASPPTTLAFPVSHLTLEGTHTEAIAQTALPHVCNPQQVTMSFEKTFTGCVALTHPEWSSLLQAPHMFAMPLEWKVTLSTSSTKPSFSEAEHGLFGALEGRSLPGTNSSVKIEIINAHTLVAQGANPLWLALRLWLAVLYVTGLEHSSSRLAPATTTESTLTTSAPESTYRSLWNAGFLCRVWRAVNQETISKRWSAAQKTASNLSNDRLFSRKEDILKHWGPLFETARDMQVEKDSGDLINVSGAMPRLYKAPREAHFILRPKLVLVKTAVGWSWD